MPWDDGGWQTDEWKMVGPDWLAKTYLHVLSFSSPGFRGPLIPGFCVSGQRIPPGIDAYKLKYKSFLRKGTCSWEWEWEGDPRCWASKGRDPFVGQSCNGNFFRAQIWRVFSPMMLCHRKPRWGRFPVFLSQLELSKCKFWCLSLGPYSPGVLLLSPHPLQRPHTQPQVTRRGSINVTTLRKSENNDSQEGPHWVYGRQLQNETTGPIPIKQYGNCSGTCWFFQR